MKRILISTVTLGLVAGLAAGCANLDEKLITGVSSTYYSTPDGLNSAVIASYSQLRNFYGREQLLSLTQVGTDTWMAADQSGSNNKCQKLNHRPRGCGGIQEYRSAHRRSAWHQ